MNIAENLAEIKKSIPSHVKLIAVSKTPFGVASRYVTSTRHLAVNIIIFKWDYTGGKGNKAGGLIMIGVAGRYAQRGVLFVFYFNP